MNDYIRDIKVYISIIENLIKFFVCHIHVSEEGFNILKRYFLKKLFNRNTYF